MFILYVFKHERGDEMEMHERIKMLRKDHLKLSQSAFGEKLGVSRSVINNIERDVLARPEQKLSLIKLISAEFNVNVDWILYGTEPMFIEPDSFSLDDFARKNNATALEIEIIKIYFELDQGIRQQIVSHFRERLASFDDVPATPAELEKQFPPVTGDGSSEAG